jgi:voltage-dependent anion channel protein 2
MAIPVKFADMGKSAKDLLKADYSPFSLEVTTQTVNGVKFTSNIKKADNNKPEVTGDLKVKYFDAANGVTFNYAFTTDKKLSAKAEAVDVLAKGLRLEGEASIKSEAKTSTNVKFGLGFKEDHVNTNASIDVLNEKLPVSADIVLGFQGFNLGGEATYNIGKGSVQSILLGASYQQPDYVFAVHAKPETGRIDVDSVTASYFHQISNTVAAGAQISYKFSSADTSLAVGTNYALDSSASVKSTVDTTGKFLLQYTQKLRPNVKAIFGTTLQWNTGSITADTGLSLTYDA